MWLDALALRPSGRAVLLEDEIERCITDNVDLKFYDRAGGLQTAPAQKYENGRVVLTSHRMLWIDAAAAPQPGTSCSIPLSAVNTSEVRTSVAARLNLSREKIKLQMFVTSDDVPAPGGLDAVKMTHLGLSFKNGIPSNFSEQMVRALAEEKWKAVQTAAPEGEDLPTGVRPSDVQQMIEMGFERNRAICALQATGGQSVPDAVDWAFAFQHDPSASAFIGKGTDHPRKVIKCGLGDILKREQEKQQKTRQTLDEAFQDLNSLMSMAEEMVKLADKFYASFGKDGDAQGTSQEETTVRELISMGITSPVTKESSGTLYHDQLCRQLADFLEPRLDKHGGVMTLPDVYSLYNRARGAAELVSPDDMMQAVRHFPKLKIPFKMRTFDSGVRVIQSSAHDEVAVCEKLGEMVGTDPDQLSRPIAAVDVATELHIPITIAQEHLLLAERHGILCRDDGPGGLRFYFNFFKNM